MTVTSTIFLSPETLTDKNYDFWNTNPVRTNLENGVVVLFEKDDSSSITVLQFYIRGGKYADSENKRGLSYLTTRLLLEIPDTQKIQDFMLQATQLMMGCENDYSVVTVSCLSDKLEDSLIIVSQIMLNPFFSTLRINRIKETMLNREKIEQDVSRNTAYQTLMDCLFKGTGYDGSVYGDSSSLKQIKKRDVIGFYEKYFTADNLIISVSTNLSKEVVTDYLNQYFSSLKSGSPLTSKDFKIPSLETENIHIPRETEQTSISIGYRLPQINLNHYVLALMLENLMGRGIGSKLWPLRKEKNLAYNISTHISYFKNGGMLESLLESKNPKKQKAVESMNHILDKLYLDGINLEELNMTKIYTKASFLRSHETKRERTSSLAFFEIMNLGPDSFKNVFKEIDRIELEEMNSFIQKILNPKNRVAVTIGPD